MITRPVNTDKNQCFDQLTLSLPECLVEFGKMTLPFESVDEILWCDHSNESSLPVLSHFAIYFAKCYKMKFANLVKICLWLHLAVKGLTTLFAYILTAVFEGIDIELRRSTKRWPTNRDEQIEDRILLRVFFMKNNTSKLQIRDSRCGVWNKEKVWTLENLYPCKLPLNDKREFKQWRRRRRRRRQREQQ